MRRHAYIPIIGFLLCIVANGESSIFVRRPRQADDVPDTDSNSGNILISDMTITSTVSVRFADVLIRSSVVNEKYDGQEVRFTVQLPLTAFITSFTMTIHGVKYVGEVLEKDAAKKLYEEAQASNETAGHVAQDTSSPRRREDMDMFTTSVNVAANMSVIFELKYQELIERRNGFYKQTLNIQPNQIVPNLEVMLTYNEPQGISSFSYTLPMKPNSVESPFEPADVSITSDASYRKFHFKMPVGKQAMFHPTTGVSGDLVISYDIDHTESLYSMKLVGSDQGSNGYVATYFSPPSGIYKILPKDIVFVIDISGSMSGDKIQHARDSMLATLKKIRSVDRFNIILFDNVVEVFADGFLPGNEYNLMEAEMYVKEKVMADGSTNINDALMQAIALFGPHLQDPRGNIVVFLTDGNPNSGAATKPADIRANVRKANYIITDTGLVEFKAAIYALGFGFDMDFEFLTNLAEENGGNARRIYEGITAHDQLVFFFDEIADPFLTDVTINLCAGSAKNILTVSENRISKHEFPYYFSGSELVIVAEIEHLPQAFGICLSGHSSSGEVDMYYPSENKLTESLSAEFIKRLYGYMQIKNLLRLKGITLDEDAATRYTKIALNMSLEYNFVTPLTSLVVTKAMQDPQSQQAVSGREVYSHGVMTPNIRKSNNQNVPHLNMVGSGASGKENTIHVYVCMALLTCIFQIVIG